jgi:TetR/AcrR family transcriptional regulator, cholesterol catabolism regulator
MNDIIQKIKEIYSRYGIKSVTMDDLSRELGMSKKTLYELFSDKEEVVSKVVNFMIDEQQKAVDQLLEQENNNAIDELLLLSRLIADHLKNVNPSLSYDLKKYYPRVWDDLVQFKSKTVFQYIMANFRKGIEQGIYSNDLYHEIVAFVYVARMEMYSLGGWTELEKYSYRDVYRTLFLYHVRGIANEKGRMHLEKLIERNPEIF